VILGYSLGVNQPGSGFYYPLPNNVEDKGRVYIYASIPLLSSAGYRINALTYYIIRTTDNTVKNHTWCDNLIPGIVAAFRWGVESGKLVYSSTFGHDPICVYMSHTPQRK